MKYLKTLSLVSLIFLLSFWGVRNINQYIGYEDLEDTISTYKSRLKLPEGDCDNVALSDKEYAKQMAISGDPNAQYVYVSYLREEAPVILGRKIFDREAVEWLKKAAKKNHIKAQGMLCSLAYSERRVVIQSDNYQHSIDWCFSAAEHNHRYSQATLGRMYYDGVGVEKNNEESYFWYKLAGNFSGMYRKVEAELTDEQKVLLDGRVVQWEPKQPSAKRSHSNSITELEWVSRGNMTMPINVKGLLCGGRARDCKISDRCGDLVGYRCRGFPRHFIASISEQKILNECPKHDGRGCLDLIPKEWNCKLADNLPVKPEYHEKFSKLRGGISCGDYVYVPSRLSSGGGIYYDRKTGDEVGKCLGPRFGKPNVTCTKPKGWYCD